jgi:hypothetical protein
MTNVRALLLPTLAGLLAGASISFAVVSTQRRAERDVSSENEPARGGSGERTSVPVLSPGSGNSRALGDLSLRMRALEESMANAEQDESEPAPDPVEEREAIIAGHVEGIEAHYREASDARWAPAATQSTQRDLESLAVSAESRFGIKGVDCRSTTCVAELEWSDYETAVNGYPDLLHHAYALNCARRIVLPEPGAPEQPYRASLLIDCSESTRASP